MSQTVKIQILGTEYPLRTNDEDLTRQIAGDVDSQLRDLQQKLPTQSTMTLAVLTALNFAEQEAHAKENHHRELDRATTEIELLTEQMDKALSSGH